MQFLQKTELVVLNILLPSGDLYVRIYIAAGGLLSSSVCLCLFKSYSFASFFVVEIVLLFYSGDSCSLSDVKYYL